MKPGASRQDHLNLDETDDLFTTTVREDGFPQATMVSYVNHRLAIYFGTSTASQRAKYISRNNKVSLTINRPYENWDEITGISLDGHAIAVTDKRESRKAGELVLKNFLQVEQYMPSEAGVEGELVLFCIEPLVVSLLDYRRGFAQTDLVNA